MKHSLLFILTLLPLITGCNFPIISEDTTSNITFKTGENYQTRNYKNIRVDGIHPEVDDGYIKISSVLMNSEHFIDVAEDITFIYKLACKNNTDSFQVHGIPCDNDGFYYAEISDTQHSMIPNGFSILKNDNYSGSSVEISIMKIYQCFTYRELYYSETEQKIKIVDFDHVIPGLEESEVNSLIGKSLDYYVYVDQTGIKTYNHGNLSFSSELVIQYIDVSESQIQIGEY